MGAFQCEIKRRALFRFALRPDSTPVAADDALHNGQADARAFKLVLRVQTLENSKEPVRFVLLKTRAVVFNEIDALPVLGAPSFSYGTWSWNVSPTGASGAGEHSSLIDARMVWWNPTLTSPVNNMPGSFVAVNNGARYGLGQWPKTLPALFTSS